MGIRGSTEWTRAEKIGIAVLCLAGLALPFLLAGLIALMS